jgi:hypothetical protein
MDRPRHGGAFPEPDCQAVRRFRLVAALALYACATFAMSGCAVARATPDPLTSVVGAPQEVHATRADTLPRNVYAAETLRPVLGMMWQRSRTFRAQCARIERAPSLRVVMTRVRESQAGQGGARTAFTRSNRLLHAQIVVSLELNSNSLIELMAHELEHVIEQLDGVHLTDRAEKSVSRDASGTFETTRAAHIGQQVAREVRRRHAVVPSTEQE